MVSRLVCRGTGENRTAKGHTDRYEVESVVAEFAALVGGRLAAVAPEASGEEGFE